MCPLSSKCRKQKNINKRDITVEKKDKRERDLKFKKEFGKIEIPLDLLQNVQLNKETKISKYKQMRRFAQFVTIFTIRKMLKIPMKECLLKLQASA